MFGTKYGSTDPYLVADSSPEYLFYKSNRTMDIDFYHPKAEMGYNEGVYKVAIVLQ